MVERQIPRALVLEDDVILSAAFWPAFEGLMQEERVLGDPHVTFLGCGGHYYIPHDQIRPGQWLYPRNQGKFADSYILSLETAERRLDRIASNGMTRPIDHTFEHIDRVLGTPMFWLEPPVVRAGQSQWDVLANAGTVASPLVSGTLISLEEILAPAQA